MEEYDMDLDLSDKYCKREKVLKEIHIENYSKLVALEVWIEALKKLRRSKWDYELSLKIFKEDYIKLGKELGLC